MQVSLAQCMTGRSSCMMLNSCSAGGAPKINREAASVVSSAGGVVRLRYQWQAGDTDTADEYDAELELDVGGSALTAPTAGYLPVVVYAGLT